MIKNILKQIYLHIEEWVSVVFITVALILLTLQVILRFVFNTSFGWIEELSRYLYIWVIYLASSAAVCGDGTARLPEGRRHGGQMRLPGAPQEDVSPGGDRRAEVGGRRDTVRDHGVCTAVKGPSAPDHHGGGAAAGDLSAAGIQKVL